MNNFFSLSNIDVDYEITLLEKITPIFILILLIIAIYINRDKIRNNKLLDERFRYYLGIISLIFLLIYYILEWCSNGITVFNLPLHICFVSNILCIILCFNKNKKIFNFVLFTGILGGLSSLLAPELDLSFKYFRYYQFMICHISIIVIPIYFMLIHKYKVNIKDTLKVIFITEVLGLSLGIFNEIYNTNYMFVSFTSNAAAKGSVLSYIGEEYFYFINLQILFLISMFLWYFILKYSYKLIK